MSIIRALVLALLLSGCVRWEHDPLDVFTADPSAFAVPLASFSF